MMIGIACIFLPLLLVLQSIETTDGAFATLQSLSGSIIRTRVHSKSSLLSTSNSSSSLMDDGGTDDDIIRNTLDLALSKMKVICDDKFAARFNKRRMRLVEVRPSSIPGAGLGLFAKEQIKAGTIVSFYPFHTIGIVGLADESIVRRVTIDTVTGKTVDQTDYDNTSISSASDQQAYLMNILGNRPLMKKDISQDLGGQTIFIDLDMTQPESLGFSSHRVNDGATVSINSEEGVLEYYRESRKAKNCVHTPFGPSPLLATVTTRKIKKGDELFTSYGCSCKYFCSFESLLDVTLACMNALFHRYLSLTIFNIFLCRYTDWLDYLLHETGEAEETYMTEAIISEAKEVAMDILKGMKSVAVTCSSEASELQAIFDA